METMTRERGRLFERPAQPRALRITDRDFELLHILACLRLASVAQLAALDGGSEQNVSRSLLALWENQFVERVIGACREQAFIQRIVSDNLWADAEGRVAVAEKRI